MDCLKHSVKTSSNYFKRQLTKKFVTYEWKGTTYPKELPSETPTELLAVASGCVLDVASYSTGQAIRKGFLKPGSSEPETRQKLGIKNVEDIVLKTCKGHLIVGVFIDRRGSGEEAGQYLVICCEGFPGDHDFGVLSVPDAKGFSVISWSYPTRNCSEGEFTSLGVIEAAETVMQYALHLKFHLSHILLFGYSFGGYPASYLATTYQKVLGLILDGTFDRMKHCIANVTSIPGLKQFLEKEANNCDNLKNLRHYGGPLLIISRCQDEIMCKNTKTFTGNITTELFIETMTKRFPNLFNSATLLTVRNYVTGNASHQKFVYQKFKVDDDFCKTTLTNYMKHLVDLRYPLYIGRDEGLSEHQMTQLVLYLVSLNSFISCHI